MTNATQNPTAFENEGQKVRVRLLSKFLNEDGTKPNPELVPETITEVDVIFLTGEGLSDKGKTVTRVKAVIGNADSDGASANAKVELTKALKAKFGDAKYHDVAAAASEYKRPEKAADKPEPEVEWTARDDVKELQTTLKAANKAAENLNKGGATLRDGLFGVAQAASKVADVLTPKQFTAWVEAGNESLKEYLASKNGKSEFTKVGRLPRDWFDAQPETTNSPKSYERRFNAEKQVIASVIGERAWAEAGKAELSHVPANIAQKATMDVLKEHANVGTAQVSSLALLARFFLNHLDEKTDGFAVDLFTLDEGNMLPAKDKDGAYIVTKQTASGNRPHELVESACKAIMADAPHVVEEQEEKDAEKAQGESLRPKTFADYTPLKAALQLCGTLRSHELFGDVTTLVAEIVGKVEEKGSTPEAWAEVLGEYETLHAAEVAKTEEAKQAETEANADDDA